MIARILLAAALSVSAPAAAQTVAIVHARIHTMGPAGEIADGTLVIRDGRIVSVGTGAPPADARIVDAGGGVVTPGLVAPVTSLGAIEARSLAGPDDRATSDRRISAAFDIGDGLNPDSVLIPVARLGGITRSIVTPGYPRGAADRMLLFAGQAAAVQLGERGPMLVRRGVAMVLELGEAGAERAGGARAAALAEVREALEDARAFARNRAGYERGESRAYALSRADLLALQPVVQGQMPLLVTVNRASDIRVILAFAREQRVRLILEGAAEGWRVADEIARAGVPVLLTPVENIPVSFEALGATLSNAALLHKAGVLIGFEGNGPQRERELRRNAGNAVPYGLPYDAALAAITANPAKIFGLAGIGSLEPGKDADVVLWSGDPLETDSRPLAIYIRGQSQPMTSRQIELRDRYLPRRNP